MPIWSLWLRIWSWSHREGVRSRSGIHSVVCHSFVHWPHPIILCLTYLICFWLLFVSHWQNMSSTKAGFFFSVLFMKCLKYLGEFPGPSKWTININELSLLCARHYAENWCWGTKKKKRTIFFTEFTVWCSPGRLGRVMGLSGSPCPQHLQFASCDVGQREWDWNGAHLNFSLDSALRRSPNHLESHFLLLKNHCEDLMH